MHGCTKGPRKYQKTFKITLISPVNMVGNVLGFSNGRRYIIINNEKPITGRKN